MRGKRVLITGGLGFIGSNIAQRCIELGAEVTIYDCLDPRSGGNTHNIHNIRDRVKMIINDVRNFEGICSCILNKDVLFNCAAYTSHPNSMKEPYIDIDVNCKGAVNVLEAARRFSPDLKIVHVGTSTQIGRMRHPVADELHPEYPVDMYSANKCASEKYVLIYGSAYRMRTTVVRLANAFGPRSNIRTPDFGFMNYFIGLGLQGKDLTVYGEGAQRRSLSYVEDCVEALLLAAVSDRSDGEVFFAVEDRQYTVKEIAEAIAHNVGGRVRFVEWPRDREAIEIGDAVISNAKIREVLGWVPRFDLPTGLTKTRDYYTSCIDKYMR